MKVGLPLVKNLLQPLAKSILIPLGLIAVVSAVDAGIHKKVLESKFLAHGDSVILLLILLEFVILARKLKQKK